MKKLIAIAVVLLAMTGCRYCPPGWECPLPDEGTNFCPGCDVEQVEIDLPVE